MKIAIFFIFRSPSFYYLRDNAGAGGLAPIAIKRTIKINQGE